MKAFKKFSFENVWNIVFEEGMANGDFSSDGNSAFLEGKDYILKTEADEKHGVFCRRDSFTNNSDKTIRIVALKSRFLLERSEYEFYTQYNSWQNESKGKWADSATGVFASSDSLRTSSGANPFLGIWDRQTSRGMSFHLIPDGSWSMSASYISSGGKEGFLLIEMGIDADNLSLCIEPGETFFLPEILYYEFLNKTDMDCYKLHRYTLDRYPRKEIGVMYNTWLYKFDRFDFDNIYAQIPVAARLGCEYFVIDAGWFGNGPRWITQIGDWNENMVCGFMGRTKELSDAVIKSGMKFGLWLEPTRAVEGSEAAKKHSDFFIKSGGNYFLDFANPDAVTYITEIIDRLIKEYNIEYFKFDDNADLLFDNRRSAFTIYNKGYRRFMERLRKTYPNIYFEGCASGGQKMNISSMRYFDSLWPTDNQGIYFGTRLLKDTILRLPPQMLDRWTVITSINSFDTYTCDNAEHIVSTGDATCDYITGVDISYLKGFLSGGPLGFSCNLASLSEKTFSALKAHIEEFKKNRDFLKNAECRILADTESVCVLQYRDREFKKNIIQIFTSDLSQSSLTIYPELKKGRTYLIDGDKKRDGEDIYSDGISVPLAGSYKMVEVIIEEV